MADAPLSGRKREAAANDQRILAAARSVFVEDPTAPISDVAARAGVGIGALYRRYPSKDALIGAVCADGQLRYIAEAERALAATGDPWEAYVGFLHRITVADTHAISSRLAGTFTPTPDHRRNAARLQEVAEALFTRTQAAGAIRPDVTMLDVGFLLEMLAGFHLGSDTRTAQLRARFLTLITDALHSRSPTPLPEPPPTWQEQSARWAPKGAR